MGVEVVVVLSGGTGGIATPLTGQYRYATECPRLGQGAFERLAAGRSLASDAAAIEVGRVDQVAVLAERRRSPGTGERPEDAGLEEDQMPEAPAGFLPRAYAFTAAE